MKPAFKYTIAESSIDYIVDDSYNCWDAKRAWSTRQLLVYHYMAYVGLTYAEAADHVYNKMGLVYNEGGLMFYELTSPERKFFLWVHRSWHNNRSVNH